MVKYRSILSGVCTASTELFSLHKSMPSKVKKTPMLSAADKVQLFVDSYLSDYCAFYDVEQGEVLQIVVPAKSLQSYVMVNEARGFHGVEVLRCCQQAKQTNFVGESSNRVLQHGKVVRWKYAEVYLVHKASDGTYAFEKLFAKDEWLDGGKVADAFKRVAMSSNLHITGNVFRSEVNLFNSLPAIKISAWCQALDNDCFLLCDLNNGAIRCLPYAKAAFSEFSDLRHIRTGALFLRLASLVPGEYRYERI